MVKLNKSELKWLIILIGLSYYLYMLLSTGRIYYFIHPRTVIYVYISFIFLLLLVIIQFRRLFTISTKRKIYFSIFLLPIILGLLVNPQGLSSEIAGKKNLSQLQTDILKSNLPLINNNVTALTHNEHNTLLQITNSNFASLTDDILHTNTDKYIGQKINVTGFVYKDGTTPKNEFLVGRLMIICCAADSEITGLLCSFDAASSLKTDQWVSVTGTIGKVSHLYSGKTQEIPVIKVEKVELTSKPIMPYIYIK